MTREIETYGRVDDGLPGVQMTETISLPTWVVAVASALVLWAVLDRLIVPSTRWLFRRRASRVIDELNTRLPLQIPLFQRTKRQVLIDRLTDDPEVMEAVETEAQQSGRPRAVLMREVERYAREIVPSFNVYVYFRIGYSLARRLLQLLYRVRLGYADDAALARIEPNASVVFVMNHLLCRRSTPRAALPATGISARPGSASSAT